MMDLDTLRAVNELAAKYPKLTVDQLLKMLSDQAAGRPVRHPDWQEQEGRRKCAS